MYSTNNLYAKLQTIAATKGKKDKQAMVSTFTDVEKQITKLALDPTMSFYIAKLELPTTLGTDEWTLDEFKLLEKLADRSVTGNAALELVQFHLRELSQESAELLRRVILKDLKCGIGVGTVNGAFPGLIPDFPYLRCSLPKDSNIEKWDWEKTGVFVQLKADGMFARIDHDNDGNVFITSRQGSTFPVGVLKPLEEDVKWALAKGTETHGELTVWINGELQPRQIGNGMLNSVQLGGELPEGAVVRFDAWDQIPLDAAVVKGRYEEPYALRFQALTNQLAEAGACNVMLIESQRVTSKAEAMAIYKEVLARRLEGVILKHPAAIWFDGDSKDQVKFKLEVDVDLEIVGFRPGEPGKRTEHTFGSVLCRTADGKLEVAVSGFKRDMEQYLHENRDSVMHKVMCVRANDVAEPSESSELFSLYHPRFVEIRSDKYEPDTLEQVLAQFEGAIA